MARTKQTSLKSASGKSPRCQPRPIFHRGERKSSTIGLESDPRKGKGQGRPRKEKETISILRTENNQDNSGEEEEEKKENLFIMIRERAGETALSRHSADLLIAPDSDIEEDVNPPVSHYSDRFSEELGHNELFYQNSPFSHWLAEFGGFSGRLQVPGSEKLLNIERMFRDYSEQLNANGLISLFCCHPNCRQGRVTVFCPCSNCREKIHQPGLCKTCYVQILTNGKQYVNQQIHPSQVVPFCSRLKRKFPAFSFRPRLVFPTLVLHINHMIDSAERKENLRLGPHISAITGQEHYGIVQWFTRKRQGGLEGEIEEIFNNAILPLLRHARHFIVIEHFHSDGNNLLQLQQKRISGFFDLASWRKNIFPPSLNDFPLLNISWFLLSCSLEKRSTLKMVDRFPLPRLRVLAFSAPLQNAWVEANIPDLVSALVRTEDIVAFEGAVRECCSIASLREQKPFIVLVQKGKSRFSIVDIEEEKKGVRPHSLWEYFRRPEISQHWVLSESTGEPFIPWPNFPSSCFSSLRLVSVEEISNSRHNTISGEIEENHQRAILLIQMKAAKLLMEENPSCTMARQAENVLEHLLKNC